jgi:hypothetical protein
MYYYYYVMKNFFIKKYNDLFGGCSNTQIGLHEEHTEPLLHDS